MSSYTRSQLKSNLAPVRRSGRQTKSKYSTTNFTQSQYQYSQKSSAQSMKSNDDQIYYSDEQQNDEKSSSGYSGKSQSFTPLTNTNNEEILNKQTKNKTRRGKKSQKLDTIPDENQIVRKNVPPSRNKPQRRQISDIYAEKDSNSPNFQKKDIDNEILKIFQSYFKATTIDPQVILTAKSKIFHSIKILLSKSIEAFVVTKNRSTLFVVGDILKTIAKLDEIYKSKVVRTFMMEELQIYTKNNKKQI